MRHIQLIYIYNASNSLHVYYFKVGDGGPDHSFWGRPEDMTMARPAYKVTTSKPGSDVAGNTAAALAAGSIVFKTEGMLIYSCSLNKQNAQDSKGIEMPIFRSLILQCFT